MAACHSIDESVGLKEYLAEIPDTQGLQFFWVGAPFREMGKLCSGAQDAFQDLLRQGDTYLLLADFQAYVDCQARVDALYRDAGDWHRRALLNVAGMGGFSSDRTIREYAEQIWHVEPVGA